MAEIKEAMPAPQPEALDMPDDEVLYELADLFRVFGDSTPPMTICPTSIPLAT